MVDELNQINNVVFTTKLCMKIASQLSNVQGNYYYTEWVSTKLLT
jgi:hypothetical protein